jgi:hypothetical protein
MLAREMDERPLPGNSQGAPKKKTSANRITAIQTMRRLRKGCRGDLGVAWSMVAIIDVNRGFVRVVLQTWIIYTN